MVEDPCKECKIHGRMEESITNVKVWQGDVKLWQGSITETLKHIVTAKAAWAFFVVFLSICLAVVGFLWQGQIAIWNNISLNHKETIHAISEVRDKVLVIDYKVQRHLDETEKNKKQ